MPHPQPRPDGDPAARTRVEKALQAGEACWCPIIRLELWNGAGGTREKKVLRDFERLLPELAITDVVWTEAFDLARRARAAAVTIPATDLLIAACARSDYDDGVGPLKAFREDQLQSPHKNTDRYVRTSGTAKRRSRRRISHLAGGSEAQLMIASFHLVHYRNRRFVNNMQPGDAAGLCFWKTLSIGPDFKALPAGFDRWTLARPDFKRWGFLGIWEDEAALDEFLDESPIPRQWNALAAETWQVRLQPRHASGTWHGADPIGKIDTREWTEGPVAMLTRGELRLSKAPTFWLTTTHPAVTDVLKAPGFLAGVALVERPFLEVMTFTLWASKHNAMDFAHRRPAHSGLIERNRTERIFRAFFYAHFQPFRSEGAWHGRDPLSGTLPGALCAEDAVSRRSRTDNGP